MMPRALLAGCLLLLALWPLVASGSAPAPALTAEQVVARHVEARGGHERLRSIATMRLTGVYLHLNQELGSVLLRKRPDRYLWVRSHGEAKLTVGHDGKDLWWINPNTQSPHAHWWVDPDLAKPPARIGGIQLKLLKPQMSFDTPLVEAREKKHTVTLAGIEDFDGRPCHKLEVKLQDGSRQTWFLDTQTFLEAAQILHVDDGETKLEFPTYFLDHKPVDGVMIPHRIENEIDEDLRTLLIRKVEFNVPLDDALFRMPQGRGGAER